MRVNRLALALLRVFREPLPSVLKRRIMDPIGASQTWQWHGYENSYVEIDGKRMQSVSGGAHWGGGIFIEQATANGFINVPVRFHSRNHLFRDLREFADQVHTLLQHCGVTDEVPKRCVDLVTDAGNKFAEGRHLFRLHKLDLGFL